MTYLLAIAAATFLRTVAIAATIARATVVRLRLVAQAIAGFATGELGLEYRLTCSFGRYRLLVLGTPTLTPEPVFSRTSTGGDLVDRSLPKRPDTLTVLQRKRKLLDQACC